MTKPTLLLDFDGVIHSYESGWKGATVIPDPPVPGALHFIQDAMKHFKVAIYSSRSIDPDGIIAMKAWLHNWGLRSAVINELEWPTQKPAAFLTIDDRALCFTGIFPDPEPLLKFKPWNKS